ncbi:MAG: DUF4142 domain-containing protein [Chthoniobacterales bacterium]
MKSRTFAVTVLIAAGLCAPWQISRAADDAQMKPTDAEKSFIMKAANGGMTEVELGKIAEQKGATQDVKDFGKRMVHDHGKANDQLKEVAGKMDVEIPDKVDAEHQATIDKFSKMAAGADFDQAYIPAMIKDHNEDIAEFQKEEKTVKNEDLKRFIASTIPVMKEHLMMIEKISKEKK